MAQTNIIKINQNQFPIIEAGYKGLSRLTQRAYKNDLNTFNSIINKDIRELTPADILQYVEALQSRGLKNSTINRKIYSLSKILTLYKIQGIIKANVITELNKIRKITKRVENIVNVECEISDIKTVITRTMNKTTVIIEALTQTGMRIRELTGIKTDNIKLYSKHGRTYREIEITGKGNKQRKIFITEALYGKIKTVFGKSRAGYLFQSKTGRALDTRNCYKMICREFLRHTGKHIHPHSLRHFYGDYQINTLKRNPKAVSVFMGHASINITYDYYIRPRFDDPAEAVLCA